MSFISRERDKGEIRRYAIKSLLVTDGDKRQVKIVCGQILFAHSRAYDKKQFKKKSQLDDAPVVRVGLTFLVHEL